MNLIRLFNAECNLITLLEVVGEEYVVYLK